jgi:hypothetical protein
MVVPRYYEVDQGVDVGSQEKKWWGAKSELGAAVELSCVRVCQFENVNPSRRQTATECGLIFSVFSARWWNCKASYGVQPAEFAV